MTLDREQRFWDEQARKLREHQLQRELEGVRQDRLFAWLLREVATGPPGRVLEILWTAAWRDGSGRGELAVNAVAAQDAAVFWLIRLPRVLLALAVGASLAAAGAAIQGLFRNPLADPALIGVSGGAALAAAAWIVLGGTLLVPAMGLPPALTPWLLPAAAFLGGLLATACVNRIGRHQNGTLGTDHGWGNAFLVLGGQVQGVLTGTGGLTGQLTESDIANNQQLPFGYDFRDVYGKILTRYLGLPQDEVTGLFPDPGYSPSFNDIGV